MHVPLSYINLQIYHTLDPAVLAQEQMVTSYLFLLRMIAQECTECRSL